MSQSSEVQTFGLFVLPARPSPDHARPHRHNEIELNYVEGGSITYLHAGHEVYIREQESAVFWGAVPHQLIRYAPGTVLSIATIPLEYVLQWDLPQPFINTLLSGTLFHTGQHQLRLYDAAMYRQWQVDVNAGEPDVALMEIKAFLHRCARLQQIERDEHPATSSDRAQRMAQFISRHFQQPISTRDVAAHVGLHPHYAMTVFKSAFDLTIMEYLTQQRIAFVQQQLLTTDASVIDIAYDAGFQAISHFYSAFNRLCGLSPGRYRAALRRLF